jgi:hypothetical protein
MGDTIAAGLRANAFIRDDLPVNAAHKPKNTELTPAPCQRRCPPFSLSKIATHRCSYQTRGLNYTPGVDCAVQAHGVWTGQYHDTKHCELCNLPALGGPTSAMCTPSRTISPRRPSCRCPCSSSRSRWTCVSVSMPLVHSLNVPPGTQSNDTTQCSVVIPGECTLLDVHTRSINTAWA